MEDKILSIEEFMELLHIGKNTAYKLLDSGTVRVFKIGNKWKIPKSEVLDYIRRQTHRAQ